jgi:hypothetical protein
MWKDVPLRLSRCNDVLPDVRRMERHEAKLLVTTGRYDDLRTTQPRYGF